MSKQAISVTLETDNLTWLRGRARAATRSVSDTLDRLITASRASGRGGEPRSVVGSVSISLDDPELAGADAVVRGLFQPLRGPASGPGRVRPRTRAPRRRRHG